MNAHKWGSKGKYKPNVHLILLLNKNKHTKDIASPWGIPRY